MSVTLLKRMLVLYLMDFKTKPAARVLSVFCTTILREGLQEANPFLQGGL